MGTRRANKATARLNERALARLWQNAHTLSDGLKTEDGRRLRVVYPGRPNQRAGPDFRDSVIETETGELLTGDVELHLNAPDWVHHNHHVDPNYNGVILHVVLHPRGRVQSEQQSKATVPVTSVEPFIDLMGQAKGSSFGGRSWPDDLGRKDLAKLLDRAGDQRFLSRSRGFALDMEAAGPEDALYCALFESLGYAANRQPFRKLARQVPMATLGSLGGEAGATRLLAIKAMLIVGAGLLPFLKSADEAQQLRVLAGYLPKTKPMTASMWHLFRVRPANHPARRVAGAAHLLDRFVESGLVRGLEGEVRRGKARMIVQRLTVRPLIGEGRAREMAVNVVLPFMHAWARLQRDSALSTRCLELYRGFPRLGDNEITREMKRLLSPQVEALDLNFARRHQGLIQLYKIMTRGIPA